MSNDLQRTIYETLGALWPIWRGKGRWVNLLARTLTVGAYGTLKPISVGRYSVWLDPGDLNDRLTYFGVGGRGNHLLMTELVRPGDVVIDGGANVGHFAATCAQLGARVYAIEANPKLCERLSRTAGVDDPPRISVHNVALWRERTELDFNIATITGWSSLIENPTFQTASKVRVQAVTLDEFAQTNGIERVRVLKLDLEGAETDALLGAKRLLERQAIDYALVESDIHRLRAFSHTGNELDGLLTSAGYVPERVIDSEHVLPISDKRRMPGSFSGDHLYKRAGL